MKRRTVRKSMFWCYVYDSRHGGSITCKFAGPTGPRAARAAFCAILGAKRLSGDVEPMWLCDVPHPSWVQADGGAFTPGNYIDSREVTP